MVDEPVENPAIDVDVDHEFEKAGWSVDAINELIDGTRELASDEHRDEAIQRNLDHLLGVTGADWYEDATNDKSGITAAITAAQTHLG